MRASGEARELQPLTFVGYLSFQFFVSFSFVSFVWIGWARKCDYSGEHYGQNLYFVGKFICSSMDIGIYLPFLSLCGREFIYTGSHTNILWHRRIQKFLWQTIFSINTEFCLEKQKKQIMQQFRDIFLWHISSKIFIYLKITYNV